MEFEVKSIKRIVADGIDLNTAKVVFKDGPKLDVTFNRLKKNLILHKWYLLGEDQVDIIYERIYKFFCNLVEQEENAA